VNTNEKIAATKSACDGHEETYGIEIPKAVRDFVASGAAFEIDGKSWKDERGDTFRVRATLPSWEALSSFGPLDDAVVGPDGDWKDAGRYLPLFLLGGSPRFLVVDLKSPTCAVGLFEEEAFGAKQARYEPQGVAKSLDELGKSLVVEKSPTFEAELADMIWEAAAEGGDEDDD
jgi:hypothetical protein